MLRDGVIVRGGERRVTTAGDGLGVGDGAAGLGAGNGVTV